MLCYTILYLFFLLFGLTLSGPASTTIIRSYQESNNNVSSGGENFNGDAWIDEFHTDNETTMANVVFSPSARTHWHNHEGGQLLRILAGSGWVCDKGSEPEHVAVGDIVWCPPGITHWHGAGNRSFLVHEAIAHGSTEWLEAVPDKEYSQAGSANDY